MRSVTLKPKCYVYVCAGCGLLACSERSDALTCSTACRVRAHRNGNVKRLKAICRRLEVRPALAFRIDAIERLRPDLFARIRDGEITDEDARPEMWAAFMEAVKEDIEAKRRAISCTEASP